MNIAKDGRKPDTTREAEPEGEAGGSSTVGFKNPAGLSRWTAGFLYGISVSWAVGVKGCSRYGRDNALQQRVEVLTSERNGVVTGEAKQPLLEGFEPKPCDEGWRSRSPLDSANWHARACRKPDTMVGHCSLIRSTQAWPRWEEPLSMVQNTRRAER